MKILFDHGTLAPLRHSLAGHSVATAFERGRSKLQNGDLIRVAEADDFQTRITPRIRTLQRYLKLQYEEPPLLRLTYGSTMMNLDPITVKDSPS